MNKPLIGLLLCALPLLFGLGCEEVPDDDDDDTVAACQEADSPTVDILQPAGGATFGSGVEITFLASVGDDVTPVGGLELHWFDLLGGDAVEFTAPAPDMDGVITFTKSDLEDGIHAISLEATDDDGCMTMDDVGMSIGS